MGNIEREDVTGWTREALIAEVERLRTAHNTPLTFARERDDAREQLRGAVEERDRYRDALGLLRGYVKFDSKAWTLINDALRPTPSRGQ